MNSVIKLSNEKIYQAFITGAKMVINEKDYLNEINVFPVKDGDTGSNLSSMMKSIIQKSELSPKLSETLDSISNAALLDSRGNSGLIFSQFFYGFTKEFNDEYMDQNKLIMQMQNGFDYAYQAIDEPVEGTIITVMRKWFEILKREKENHDNLYDYLISANSLLKEQLLETTNELQILKQYNVVDAGAKGFTLFIDGFVKAIVDENIELDIVETNDKKVELAHQHDSNDFEHRYCTELLLESNADKKSIVDSIADLGDSIVVGESKKYKRVHLHTNYPELVIEKLNDFSKVIETKIDDMKKQHDVVNNRKYDICIVTDSIADLPVSFVEENQVQVFPVSILMNDVTYYDKLTIKNDQFFKMIENSKEYPKSAAPSMLSVQNLFSFLSTYYQQIIVVTVSSKMSATYSIFKKAAEMMNNVQITVVDSKQNSVSQGLIVKEVVSLIESGKSYEEILEQIEAIKQKTKILVHVNTLDNMVRSGRIKKSLGIVGKILHLKPMVSIDEHGEGIVMSKSIGKKSNIRRIIQHIQKTHQKHQIKTYAIVHVNNMKLAEYIKTQIINITGFKPEYITDISTVIAMNSGQGSVAVGYIRKD